MLKNTPPDRHTSEETFRSNNKMNYFEQAPRTPYRSPGDVA